jgi:DNA-binding FrmR family transcriptional regulator
MGARKEVLDRINRIKGRIDGMRRGKEKRD